MQVQTTISGLLTPYDEETVTVSTAAEAPLTAAKYIPRGSADVRDLGTARVVMVSVEGRVRYRLTGNNPTAEVGGGHILNDGDGLTLSAVQQFKNFRAIRHEAETADATLFVTYLR